MSILGNPVLMGGNGGGGANIQSLSVTQNGTYTASGGVDGYSPVAVNVQSSSDAPVSTIAVVNGSVVSDGVTITAQPVISNGQMTASSSAGLEFKLNPVMDVEIEFDYTPEIDATVLSFGGSNTSAGVLGIQSYQFEFYANGLDLVAPISVSVGVQYHVKIEISQSTCKLYLDGTLAATLTHNIFATVAAYIANKNSIALLWNQSWHGEYNTSLVNNLSIKLVSYITA